MSNSRFLLVNLAEAGTIANDVSAAHVRTETAPFLMERLLDPDRKSVWLSGAANGTDWVVDIDLGGAHAVAGAALLAVEGDGAAVIELGYYASYPTGLTVLGNLIKNGRDWGLTLSPTSKRYWSLRIQGGSYVSGGRLWLAAVTDLGVIGLPDATSAPKRSRVELPQTDGSIVMNDFARPGHEFSIDFMPKDLTALASYEALIANPGTVVFFDERDRCFECVITGGKIGISRRLGSYPVHLEMTRCP